MDNVPPIYDNIGFEQRLVDHYVYVAKGAYREFVRQHWGVDPGGLKEKLLIEERNKEFPFFAEGFFDGMRERFNDTDYAKESYEIWFGYNGKVKIETSPYDLYCYGYDSGEYQVEWDHALLCFVAQKAAEQCIGDDRASYVPPRSITMSQGRGPLEVSNLCD